MDDLAMIGTQEFKDEILVEYKKTLNASQAVTFAIQRHAAIDEERQRREAAEVERANRKQAQMRVEDIVQETRAATSPMAPPSLLRRQNPRCPDGIQRQRRLAIRRKFTP